MSARCAHKWRLRTVQAMMRGRAEAGHPSISKERHLRELHAAIGTTIEAFGGAGYEWDD